MASLTWRAVLALAGLSSGCTMPSASAIYQHPVTGETRTCKRDMAPDTISAFIQANRFNDCKGDAEEAGFKRVERPVEAPTR